jgi:molybdopterin-containing oxidoreductase family iron-sulfur binding subunit
MSSDTNAKQPNAPGLDAQCLKPGPAAPQRFWQSLEQLAETKEYREYLENEFPANAETHSDGINRREMLKLAAASAALAGLSACTKLPAEKIVPYVKPPEQIIPGKPLFYATSMPLAGVGAGLLVESHMGRPTKIEGNPEHPGSLGGTDVFAQASVLTLYDPDRSQTVMREGRTVRAQFVREMRGKIELAPADERPLLERALRYGLLAFADRTIPL